jgi:hypothetical protein
MNYYPLGSAIMKDYFNGNIKDPKRLVVDIYVFSVIMIICSIVFVWSTFNVQDPSTRNMCLLLAVVSFIIAIANPIATIYFVKNRDKYPRIATLLIKKDRFKNKKHLLKK